jgi:alkyl hydroperoxide reductase subunit AhpF
MSRLGDEERAQVRERLAGLTAAVRLVFFGQSIDCETCDEARRLLEELAAANPLITMDQRNLVLDRDAAQQFGIDRAPGVAVAGSGDPRIRFLGAPLGYEFASLLDAVVTVSTANTDLTAETRERLTTLTKPVHVRVFSTPT